MQNTQLGMPLHRMHIHGHRYRQQVYEHSPAGITENEEVKILWDFTIQTDHEMNYRRHDVTVHDNNNSPHHAVPSDSNVESKEREKQEKYHDLVRERLGLGTRLWRAETKVIAELSRAKRASGAPWVRKFGKLSIRENLVMT